MNFSSENTCRTKRSLDTTVKTKSIQKTNKPNLKIQNKTPPIPTQIPQKKKTNFLTQYQHLKQNFTVKLFSKYPRYFMGF